MHPLRSGRPLLALAALALTACSSAHTRAYNLRELHRADGGPRLSGALMTDFEFAMRTTLQQGDETGVHVARKPPVRIDDPHGKCFENLRALAKAPIDAKTISVQVEFFTWLGVDDRYVLSRECAVTGLGPVARKLGITRRSDPPLPEDALDANEVVRLTTPVVRGASDILLEAGDGDTLANLEAAVDALVAAPMDRDGARRVLALIGILVQRARGTQAEAPLMRLEARLHEDLVAWALTLALVDESPVVRAAAVGATRGFDADERERILVQAIEDPYAPSVRVAGLRALASEGLPRPENALLTRRQWLERLLDVSQSVQGSESLAACDALSTVADAGFRSSRGEDWIVWWVRGGGSEAEAEPEPPDLVTPMTATSPGSTP